MKQLKHLLYFTLGALVFSCSKSDDPAIAPLPTNEIIYGINKANMLSLINGYRTAGCQCGTESMPAVAKLAWNDKLGKSASKHSTDMATKNYFSHTSQDGRTMADRVNSEGYTWTVLGENIALGQTSEKQVMESWINSPGHCKNIMNARFTEVGFGREKNYWTQNFGRPR